MPAVNPIKFISYVCKPSEIVVEANHKTGSRFLYVCSKINGKVGFEANYMFAVTEDKDKFHEKVKTFCNAMLMFTEDEVQDYVDEDKIMPALYAYRHLKEVRERGGGLIWKRP